VPLLNREHPRPREQISTHNEGLRDSAGPRSVSVDDVERNACVWHHLAGVEPLAARLAPREDMPSWPGKGGGPNRAATGATEGAGNGLTALRYARNVATPAEHLRQQEVALASDGLTPAQRGAARLAWLAAQKGLGEPVDISVTAADTLAELRASAEV